MEAKINIQAIIPAVAERKAKAAELLANALDVDTIEFLANLAKEKGPAINNSIRSNKNLIKTYL